jgi:hypothetical protein
VFPIKAEGTFDLLGSLFMAYNPLKTLLVLGCVFSTWSTVPEKCIKTKEIPFREKIIPKETPCLDLISHPTCLSAYKTGQLESGGSRAVTVWLESVVRQR